MLISPEQFFEQNIKYKNQAEQVRSIRKLRADILALTDKINRGELCLEKPDYKTQLQALKSYENYIIDYYMKARIFYSHYEKDPTWINAACDFILACREYELSDLGLEELVSYFTINSDLDDLGSFEKFEHFKKYKNRKIDQILDAPKKTKLSYYKIMQQKLRDFNIWFTEEERPRL